MEKIGNEAIDRNKSFLSIMNNQEIKRKFKNKYIPNISILNGKCFIKTTDASISENNPIPTHIKYIIFRKDSNSSRLIITNESSYIYGELNNYNYLAQLCTNNPNDRNSILLNYLIKLDSIRTSYDIIDDIQYHTFISEPVVELLDIEKLLDFAHEEFKKVPDLNYLAKTILNVPLPSSVERI